MSKNQKIISASLLLWLGFVLAISFMEAWIKFRAPGVTIGIALGIGKMVFGALNKVEWFFAIIIIICLAGASTHLKVSFVMAISLAAFILIVDTLYLLPQLAKRADFIIAGLKLKSSSMHIYYVGGDILKVVLLGYASIMSLSDIGKIRIKKEKYLFNHIN